MGIEEETRLIAGLGDDVVADSGWGYAVLCEVGEDEVSDFRFVVGDGRDRDEIAVEY